MTRLLLLNILVLWSVNLLGQQNKTNPTFKKSDYPPTKFNIQRDTSYLGHVAIIRTMVHPIKENNIFLCRTWLTIKKNATILKQKYYDIEPVGGCSGIYFPTKQPCKDYFILSKFGDYNGETLIVDTTGKLTILKGGAFSISKDNQYLFATYDSDISGITIYNLKEMKLILSKESTDENRYDECYFQEGKYYVTIQEDTQSTENRIGIIDIKNKKLTITKRPKPFLKSENKLTTYNSVQTLPKCNCGQ